MEEREPNPSEDPRQQEQGSSGYPEEQPGGGVGGSDSGGTQDERDTSGAPDTSSPNEGDSDQATGNRDAAG